MKLERLTVDFEVKQILEDMDDGFFRFEGLASTFGNIDLVNDTVSKGAFQDSIRKIVPKILWQHSTFEPIGMPEILQETDKGLFVRAKLPKEDTFVTGRVIPQVKVGSISAMSIGFTIPEGGAELLTGGRRVLNKIDLKEISLVSFPADEKATVSGFKSVEDADNAKEKSNKSFYDVEDAKKLTPRELENALRDSGVFSKKAATFLSSTLDVGEPNKEEERNGAYAELLTKADKHLEKNAFDELMKKVNSYAS